MFAYRKPENLYKYELEYTIRLRHFQTRPRDRQTTGIIGTTLSHIKGLSLGRVKEAVHIRFYPKYITSTGKTEPKSI